MAMYDHQSLSLRVSDVERERAERVLQEAYVEGRVDMADFDHRMGLAMAAETRRDLNASLAGLPAPARSVAPFATHLPATGAASGTGMAAAAHFLPFVTWIFGPLAIWVLSAPRSYARKEAAKAFNWQLTASVVLMVLGVVANLLGFRILDQVLGLAWVGWLVLTIVGGAKAAQGAEWRNPLNRVLPWNVLDPSGR